MGLEMVAGAEDGLPATEDGPAFLNTR